MLALTVSDGCTWETILRLLIGWHVTVHYPNGGTAGGIVGFGEGRGSLLLDGLLPIDIDAIDTIEVS